VIGALKASPPADFGRLSGGQRQLASLAQAIVRTPQLLLLDEPTSALDQRHQLDVMTVVRDLAREGRIVVVAHLAGRGQAAASADLYGAQRQRRCQRLRCRCRAAWRRQRGFALGANARPGDLVGVRGPVGRPLPAADRYLLVGDETALPVIARTLEALPTSAKGVAIIEVADASEQQPIRFAAGVELRWLHRSGAEPGTTSLLVDAVRGVEMPAGGIRIHAMAGVEYTAFKAIRRYWRDELKLDKKDVPPVAYWRRGHSEGEVAPDDEKD
jgi:hypothetical protein